MRTNRPLYLLLFVSNGLAAVSIRACSSSATAASSQNSAHAGDEATVCVPIYCPISVH